MSMISCYQKIDGATLARAKTKSGAEIMEALAELQNSSAAEVYYMDKLWDGLHCLLTGASASTPIENNLLSEAILGTETFFKEEEADPISYVLPTRAKEILAALAGFDIERALSDFSPEDFDKKGIYPSIWLEEEKDGLRQELAAAFEGLKAFYEKAVQEDAGIIVIIG